MEAARWLTLRERNTVTRVREVAVTIHRGRKEYTYYPSSTSLLRLERLLQTHWNKTRIILTPWTGLILRQDWPPRRRAAARTGGRP